MACGGREVSKKASNMKEAMGRLTLVKSTLSSQSIYHKPLFIILRKVSLTLGKIQRNILYKGALEKRWYMKKKNWGVGIWH